MKSLKLYFILSILSFGCKQSEKVDSFEKIVFHTSACEGTCPDYHLEVDNNKNIKLHSELAYKKSKVFPVEYDSTKIGHFTGMSHDSLFKQLNNQLDDLNLDELEFGDINCCDAPLITIIVYYNGKRKFLRSMFPTAKARPLINTLKEIAENSKWQRTTDKFSIETEKNDK